MRRVLLFFAALILSGCDDPEMLCITAQPPAELSGPPIGQFFLRTYPSAAEVREQCEALGLTERARACSTANQIVLIAVGPDNNYRNFGCDLLHETGHMKQRERGLPLNHDGWRT